MESTQSNNFKKLKVTGTPSVKLVEPTEVEKYDFSWSYIILLLGPTGSGKSTFIEALASDPSLRISSNQLEGFTQTISAYQLVNVQRNSGRPIYLVDLPGFADTKISELRIISMLKEWPRDKAREYYLDRIMYFMPINNPRLPRSQKEVLRTFQALTGIQKAEGITVVTTMWDCLGSDAAKHRAECNFERLRDDFWKEYISRNTEILKFENTQQSALSVLDHACQRFATYGFQFQPLFESKVSLGETTFANNIYNHLQTRIQNLQTELANIQSDLLEAEERGDEQLIVVLLPRRKEAQKLLGMFNKELQELVVSDAPNPRPTMYSHQDLNETAGVESFPEVRILRQILDTSLDGSVMEVQCPVEDLSQTIAPVPQQPDRTINHSRVLSQILNQVKMLIRMLRRGCCGRVRSAGNM